MTARGSRDLLTDEGAALPDHEASRLLMAASGRSRAEVLSGGPIDGNVVSSYQDLVTRRLAGEPLQYLEGTVDFGPIELLADRRALIPRPETEQLWERAVDLAARPRVIVDMCTGSGNLALALKHSFPDAIVYGCDIAFESLELAKANTEHTGLQVNWRQGDLFAALPNELTGRIDLLVANPPYVTPTEFEALPVDVRDHEPLAALVSGPRGTEVIARIGREAAQWLVPGGLVLCEIGEEQGDAARAAFRTLQPVIEPDLADRDRFVVARAADPAPQPSR